MLKESRIKDFPISRLLISTLSDIGINQKTGRTAISGRFKGYPLWISVIALFITMKISTKRLIIM
ncbi:hypothetical protein [Candidatus Coxiella mudrowiae]|uniref:hypothetical protein n=1 Tax=Candidatus Coxiella mudrowiae TaxID=2054173 RepID=UPI0012FED05E|nr:hypothetical protein [Candidatus Coxiella mudrowiae]